ncbi:MAG: hypothetical protein OXO51_09220 [Gemmatimonadota bacterium]|nr:hypothetical protein [Gemmatimonadota bacterium]
MSIIRFAMALIVGTLVLLVLGFILYAMVFTGYFAANAEPGASAVAKDSPDMLFIYLSEVILAALLCLVIGCWAGVSGVVAGLRTGAVFGFLMSLAISMMFYGTVNYMNLQATLFDVVLTTVRVAVAGAVIGIVLRRKQPAGSSAGSPAAVNG